MSQILNDGSVVPSNLSTRFIGMPLDNKATTNISLRFGEVIEILYPTDPNNRSKKFIEYTVRAQEKDGNGPLTTRKYYNCTLINLFGGVADKIQFTLRSGNKDNPSKFEDALGLGSKILIGCINGDSSNAVILGGVRDAKNDSSKDQKSDGHNFYFEFNGIIVNINDNGELDVLFSGATDANGNLRQGVDSSASNSSISFDKTGGIKLKTGDGNQTINLRKDNQNIEVNAQNNVTIKSSGVLVGSATDAWVLGTTYRTAESTLNSELEAGIDELSALVISASAALNTAGGECIIPIVGPMIGSSFFVTAATQIMAMGPILDTMSAAISSFEANAEQYLSQKNKTD